MPLYYVSYHPRALVINIGDTLEIKFLVGNQHVHETPWYFTGHTTAFGVTHLSQQIHSTRELTQHSPAISAM